MRYFARLTVFLIAVLTFVSSSPAEQRGGSADYDVRDVTPSLETRGRLYAPKNGEAPHIGVLLMHRTADFRNHIATRELAKRGFVVLGMNSRFEGDESAVEWEKLPLDAKAGVELLKQQPGITKIVLFCHSGGGSLLGCYQALAENGADYAKGPNKITPGTDALAGLPTADGVIFVDAHPGIAVNMLRSLDPSIIDENDLTKRDETLNASTSSRDAEAPSIYTEEFKQRYVKGQAERMNRLITKAQQELATAKASGAEHPEKTAFPIAGTGGARMGELFPDLGNHTLQPRQFLKNDGNIATQVVTRVLPKPQSDAGGARRGGGRGAGAAQPAQAAGRGRGMTLVSFLTANSVRATDSVDNIDWCSTNSSTPCAAAAISVPTLVMSMGAHTFIRDGEVIFEAAKSKDKEFIVIEGATHDMVPCAACEETAGQFGNVTKNHFDHVAKWIKARF